MTGLTSPDLELQTDSERRAKSLRVLRYGWLIVGLLAIVFYPLFPDDRSLPNSIIISTFSTFLLVFALQRFQKPQLAGWVFAIAVDLSFLGFFLIVVQVQGPAQAFSTEATLLMLMGAAIVFAGNQIGKWASVIMAGFNSIVLIGLVLYFGLDEVVDPRFSVHVMWWLLALASWLYENNLEQSFAKLLEYRIGLEQRVEERTRDLQMAASMSKKIATVLALDELLDQIVKLTLESLSLYHVSVHLYDEVLQTLTLAAGTGQMDEFINQQIVSQTIKSQDSISRVLQKREPVLVNNLRARPDFIPNPIFPNTRSELIVPLIVGHRLIGVLDLKSDQVNRFSDNELQVIISLAEQLAIAIQNAQLYADQVRVSDELRRLDRMKVGFLASVSHELRSPLNAILNFNQFVSSGLHGPINQKQQDVLEKSTDSARHLLALINDVLDVAKIESGMVDLNIEKDINLYTELAHVADLTRALLDERLVDFVEEVEQDLPLVTGDKRRIRQIVLNLTSNAAKFTKEGYIKLRAWQKDNDVIIAVEDSGPGITVEDQAVIFEPFRQLTRTSAKAGTGLGLSISRHLAEAHDGKLWLESMPGEGSTFFVSFPITR